MSMAASLVSHGASWAGWFNLLGQIALTSVIAYTMANQVASMVLLGTGGALAGGHVISPAELLGIYAGMTHPSTDRCKVVEGGCATSDPLEAVAWLAYSALATPVRLVAGPKLAGTCYSLPAQHLHSVQGSG